MTNPPCSKTAYPTAERAVRATSKMAAQRGGLQLRVYQCPKCGLFHMTKQPPKYNGVPPAIGWNGDPPIPDSLAKMFQK